MPMRVDAGAKILYEPRVTLIRAIGTLKDHWVDAAGGLKDQVRQTMLAKGYRYAESDVVIGALRATGRGGAIDPRKLYAQIAAGKLTLAQFFHCVTVRREPLSEIVGDDLVDELTPPPRAAGGNARLDTEFKIGHAPALDRLAAAVERALFQTTAAVPIKAS
jgi:hypothetical protein